MQLNNHTSSQFDAVQEQLSAQIVLMGALAERQLVSAVEFLASGDVRLMTRLVQAEVEINQLEVSLDEQCTLLIARRQPSAVDLRMVTAALKIITDIERIGDEAKKIGLLAGEIHRDRWHSARFTEIRHAADLVIEMLRAALRAYSIADATDAPRIMRQDVRVDQSFGAILREQMTYMVEDPRTISSSLDLIFAAKSLERIGDHAKNIAEHAVYVALGRNVRHGSAEDVERALRS